MSFHLNIVEATKANTDFRRVLVTTPLSQLTLMSVLPGEEIGLERHHLDQQLFFVQGTASFVVGDHRGTVGPGDVVIVPAGNWHNFVNTGVEPLKLYTVYAPPEHEPGTVHRTKAEADAAEAAEHAAEAAAKPSNGLTVGSLFGERM